MEYKTLFPKFISIQTTSVCNAGCIFCPNTEIKELFAAKVMEDLLFHKIIDECKNYHSIERISLYLNNEPLTDRNIVKKINYAKRSIPWARVEILTNGSLLNDRLQDDLISSKLDEIGISFHGINKSTIEQAMKVDYDSTFARIKQFIKKARKRRHREDFIKITFLKHQFLSNEEKDLAIDFWKEQGIKQVSFLGNPISCAGNVKAITAVYHHGIGGCKSIATNEMIHIVENGDVVLCCMDWKREVILGNLKDNTIHQIWGSNLYNQARLTRDGLIRSNKNFICKRCELAVSSEDTGLSEETGCLNDDPRILMVMAPMWATDMPPLGVSSLAAYLKNRDISVDILDLNIMFYERASDEKKMLWDMQKYNYWGDEELFSKYTHEIFDKEIVYYAQQIINRNTKIVGFSLYGTNNLISIELAKELKKLNSGIFIVFGGPACYWLEENSSIPSSMYSKTGKLLFPAGLVDAFVRGEGEKTLEEIILAYQKEEGFKKDIPGAIIYRDGSYFKMPARPPLTDLDALPAPDFHKLPLELYKTQTLPLATSRGCVRRCNFCNDHAMRDSLFHSRSARNIFGQMLQLNLDFGVTNFQFVDLLINGNLRVLEDLCDILIQENLNIRWTAQAIIRPEMRIKLFRKMHEAGCQELTFGAESFSDPVLENMGKPYTSEVVKHNLKDSKKAGIKNSINLIIGFCGENDEDFNRTLSFLKKYHYLIDAVSSLNPCNLNAGTQIALRPEEFMIKPSVAADRCFKWESMDGMNNYPNRKNKVLKVEDLLHNLSIPLSFVGLYDANTDGADKSDTGPDLLLASLPPGKETHSEILPDTAGKNHVEQIKDTRLKQNNASYSRRTVKKWLLLFCAISFISIYIFYFWLTMIIRSRLFLGGRRK